MYMHIYIYTYYDIYFFIYIYISLYFYIMSSAAGKLSPAAPSWATRLRPRRRSFCPTQGNLGD